MCPCIRHPSTAASGRAAEKWTKSSGWPRWSVSGVRRRPNRRYAGPLSLATGQPALTYFVVPRQIVEEETAKRIELMVNKRVDEELERRKDEIEMEVTRRVEAAKAQMEQEMMAELERRRAQAREDERQREVGFGRLGPPVRESARACARFVFAGAAGRIAGCIFRACVIGLDASHGVGQHKTAHPLIL